MCGFLGFAAVFLCLWSGKCFADGITMALLYIWVGMSSLESAPTMLIHRERPTATYHYCARPPSLRFMRTVGSGDKIVEYNQEQARDAKYRTITP